MKNQGIPKGQKVTMGESIPAPQLGSSFKAPSMQYIQAIYNQFAGAREEALADLTVYLQNPVGVGEHPHIGEEIKNLVKRVDEYDSLVECMEKHFVQGKATDANQQNNTEDTNTPSEAP